MLVNLTIYWFTSESLVMRKVKKQSGFTLVEIAIVLVIIGLLLGGVLKGQELIESSKIKTMVKDLNGFSAMVMGYQERYRGVPGDDSTAAVTGPPAVAASYSSRGWGALGAGNADGLIGAVAGTTALMFPPDAENLVAIQALRFAGFLEGSGTSTSAPRNAAGGLVGFANGSFAFLGQNVVCFNGLSGKQAGALDRLLDDGINTTGSVRADTGNTVTIALPGGSNVYSESATGVTLCKTL